jgi:hypothetical protein
MMECDIADLLRHHRYPHTDEKQLQDGIEKVLQSCGIDYRREVRLTAQDRPDFMVGTVAIEIKIKGPFIHVLRQLVRYAEHEQVTGLVLVTTKASHLNMPAKLHGKPVVVASLMEGAF